MTRFGFNIRTKTGQRVDNIQIMAASMGDAERRLRQMYLKCEIIERREQPVHRPHRGRRHPGRRCAGPHGRVEGQDRHALICCGVQRRAIFGGRVDGSERFDPDQPAPSRARRRNACRQIRPSATPLSDCPQAPSKAKRTIRVKSGQLMVTAAALPAQHRDPRCRPGQADALRPAEGAASPRGPAAARPRARHRPQACGRSHLRRLRPRRRSRARPLSGTRPQRGRCRIRRRGRAMRWRRRCRNSPRTA